MEYEDFLKKLSCSKGLIFLPNGGDTCPRLVMEAKMLGCELVLNEHVQHKDDDWFTGTPEECMAYLRTRVDCFWKETLSDNEILGLSTIKE